MKQFREALVITMDCHVMRVMSNFSIMQNNQRIDYRGAPLRTADNRRRLLLVPRGCLSQRGGYWTYERHGEAVELVGPQPGARYSQPADFRRDSRYL